MLSRSCLSLARISTSFIEICKFKTTHNYIYDPEDDNDDNNNNNSFNLKTFKVVCIKLLQTETE
jgi:hypothetical protein